MKEDDGMYPETWRSLLFYILMIGLISYAAHHFPNSFIITWLKQYAGWILGLCLIVVVFTATGHPFNALDIPLLLFVLVLGYLLIKKSRHQKK
ncbi:hypothetical protein [Lactiplantibacillus pingfangensis]|uniref:hypothetical protein n=1 Tax=Lactiplantibacillus pingfangensis TaxID=2559915 RepID=UPI0010F68212|nr:hypothetical protein [Lactiplantibacillus pingfangensis]